MSSSGSAEIVAAQRLFFSQGHTRSIAFRIEQLKKLEAQIRIHEEHIIAALRADLGVSSFDAYVSGVYLSLQEIKHMVRCMPKWAKEQTVTTPLFLWPMCSGLIPQPHGIALIFGGWNYPFYLTLMPLIGAIAAGNCAVIRLSDKAPTCQRLLEKLINEIFTAEYVQVLPESDDMLNQLSRQKFDYLFFTGSAAYAEEIVSHFSSQLIPMTLELGGKSPCIIDASADVDLAAKKVAWAKFLNAGQSCVAPDYLLLHKSIKDTFIKKLTQYIRQFYMKTDCHARIVSDYHMQRLARLLEHAPILFGGMIQHERNYIEPTVVELVNMKHPLMQEEIFGPILPVISYESFDEAMQIINQHPQPLAVYLFTRDAATTKSAQRVITGCFGLNELVLQASNYYLPFGGVGRSGMGRYHGKASFDAFSSQKAIIKKGWCELPLRYPDSKLRLYVRKLLALFS